MEHRHFVAASGSYICYGLKAGQLRVLHRGTAARALLRGHTAPVTDVRSVDLMWSLHQALTAPHRNCERIIKTQRYPPALSLNLA